MNDTTVLQVRLKFADGRRQELTVDSDTALLGSGAHCEIRLPQEDAALEQLEILTTPMGLVGKARSLDRPILLDGVPFVEGRLQAESELEIGSVRLGVTAVTVDLRANVSKQQTDPASRAIRLLGLLGLPLGFYLVLATPNRASGLPTMVEPPALWPAVVETCPQKDGEAAAAFGRAELARAAAERERAPFSGRSGVVAASSFERAGSCLAVAGDASGAEDARAQARNLKLKVEREFHVHRVRLERALATQRYPDAHVEISLLLSFVGKRGGEYQNWLLSLDRQIELKFVGKRK